jgi:hypothetical protein
MEEPSPVSPATRGRPFQKGNHGRKPGSKNRASVIAATLLKDQAADLVSKAIEFALAGDVTMLKFLIGRLLPRDRLIEFDLPRMDSADDAIAAFASIAAAVSAGTITPSEAAGLASVVDSQMRAIDVADVVKRLDILEATFKAELRP